MTLCRDNRAFRLALAVAMVLSLLLAPIVDHAVPPDHAASGFAELERLAPSVAVSNEHGHGHDDAWPRNGHAGHSHEHNPADHSHDVPVSADVAGHALPAAGNAWRVAALLSHDAGPPFGIERPPRS